MEAFHQNTYKKVMVFRMWVNDRTEYIGTSGFRLSSELCECTLNSRERSGSAYIVKPVHISSRVRRVEDAGLANQDARNSCSARCTFC